MRSILVFAATLVVASSMAEAAVPGHQVTSLPGWEGPLTSKMFSGILPAGESCTDEGCFKMQVCRPARLDMCRAYPTQWPGTLFAILIFGAIFL